MRSSRTAPTVTGCSCFPILGEFPQLALEFDKLLRALATYVPWVATVEAQVVYPSAKFLGLCQRFELGCVDLYRGKFERGRSGNYCCLGN